MGKVANRLFSSLSPTLKIRYGTALLGRPRCESRPRLYPHSHPHQHSHSHPHSHLLYTPHCCLTSIHVSSRPASWLTAHLRRRTSEPYNPHLPLLSGAFSTRIRIVPDQIDMSSTASYVVFANTSKSTGATTLNSASCLNSALRHSFEGSDPTFV